jgi:hypothetical protein
MDDYITPTELTELLSVAWLPCFALGALIQFLGLRRAGLTGRGGRLRAGVTLISAFVAEFALAAALLISPLSRFASPMYFLGRFDVIRIPFQAGLVATLLVTGGGLLGIARFRRLKSTRLDGPRAGGAA